MPRAASVSRFDNLGELLDSLGGIDPRRICYDPPPGKASEEDLLRLNRRRNKLYELIDGTLVEKVMGYNEGGLAADLIRLLGRFLDQHDLGDVLGADTTMRILPKMVRLPDVAFVRWEKYPKRERPAEAIPDLAPDLAVEVLSESNTPGEMTRKLKDYFLAGVSIVWFVDLRKRTVTVHTPASEPTLRTESQTLDGGDVLPGLKLPVRDVFARVSKSLGKKPSRRKRK